MQAADPLAPLSPASLSYARRAAPDGLTIGAPEVTVVELVRLVYREDLEQGGFSAARSFRPSFL